MSLTIYHATLGDSRIKIAQTFTPDVSSRLGRKYFSKEKTDQNAWRSQRKKIPCIHCALCVEIFIWLRRCRAGYLTLVLYLARHEEAFISKACCVSSGIGCGCRTRRANLARGISKTECPAPFGVRCYKLPEQAPLVLTEQQAWPCSIARACLMYR